ncbi:hypothetical protein ANANG_G00101270 [Anguilla anguilla]|uniref:IBB domain-containing protein n=1 Tax=Anguilla anguilla TaxID=7936 RepID=A0A9D3RYN8_ANGAN|nr:hypothetical protein ANANG_G00101270 [Anguilla anguilla]
MDTPRRAQGSESARGRDRRIQERQQRRQLLKRDRLEREGCPPAITTTTTTTNSISLAPPPHPMPATVAVEPPRAPPPRNSRRSTTRNHNSTLLRKGKSNGVQTTGEGTVRFSAETCATRSWRYSDPRRKL